MVAWILMVALVAGCFWAQPEVLTPTTVGVVTRVERLEGRSVAYHLASSQVVKIDLSTADIRFPAGGAGEGMLLLAGKHAGGRDWLVGLYPNTAADVPEGCFQLVATGVGNGDWINFSNGLHLRKALDFDPGSVSNDQFILEHVTFCINERGEVLSYG